MNNSYEVQNPWADVDPISLTGLALRVSDLSNKKIGLYCNPKRATIPIFNLLEEKLKNAFPSSEITRYLAGSVIAESVTENKKKYEDWVNGVDAVVAAFGD
jgi:hypothetical protein